MTVGELIKFLSQFNTDQPVAFFLDGEDQLHNVRCFREPDRAAGPSDEPYWPMIVLECTELCPLCGALIPADDIAIPSRAHRRDCSLHPNNKF
jgi:hypothetical protein